MYSIAVIGKNFGDEGKGLAAAALSCCAKKGDLGELGIASALSGSSGSRGEGIANAVRDDSRKVESVMTPKESEKVSGRPGRVCIIKHNGGAQAGHTVESADGSYRFVHHQIGSGAEYGAVTLFSDTYMPDLYQLGKEVAAFREAVDGMGSEDAVGGSSYTGSVGSAGSDGCAGGSSRAGSVGIEGASWPQIYAEPETAITTIDDVLLNMALESLRGDERHGSCGMGINECCERRKAGFHLRIADVQSHPAAWLLEELERFRVEYTLPRARALGISEENDYWELLNDRNVLEGYAFEAKANAELVTIVDADRAWLESYDLVIFESGQGLLLDEDYLAYAPHLTSSKTGLHNPVLFLAKRGIGLDEALYVTRPYVTRHGVGPLPCEDASWAESLGLTTVSDATNQPNDWQGSIRYAKHESLEAFTQPVLEDMEEARRLAMPLLKGHESPRIASLLVTHLDETEGKLYFWHGTRDVLELVTCPDLPFDRVYGSYSRHDFEKLHV